MCGIIALPAPTATATPPTGFTTTLTKSRKSPDFVIFYDEKRKKLINNNELQTSGTTLF